MTAEFEIRELRRVEARMSADSAEADVLIRKLLPVYLCDFVLARVPDNMWFALPKNWQSGIDRPLRPHPLPVPYTYRGAVGVSITTLRKIAENFQ